MPVTPPEPMCLTRMQGVRRCHAMSALILVGAILAGCGYRHAEAGDGSAAVVATAPRQSICPTYGTEDCERHLAECERLHGANSAKTADAMLWLASSWFEEGETAKSDAMFRKAIDATAIAYGENSTKTALALLCCADFLVQESRPREAVPLLQRALAIHEDISGRDHPETVLVIRTLTEALLMWEGMAQNQTAPQVARHAPDDPDYFRAHEHIGSRLFQAGELDASCYHFRRAVELRPDLGENHNNMGTVLSAQGRLDEAIGKFEEAEKLAPEVRAIAVNFANALATAERFPEAEAKYLALIESMEKAHAAARMTMGKDAPPLDPTIAALINNYGVTLFKQGKKDEAIAAFRRALAINPNLEDAIESLALATGEEPMPAMKAATPPQSSSP